LWATISTRVGVVDSIRQLLFVTDGADLRTGEGRPPL
jgi:hypothetical protein